MKFDIFKPLVIHELGKQAIQEDAVFPEKGQGSIHDRLFVVCDGMGGEGRGDVASKSVCAAISDYIFQNTCTDEPFDEETCRMAFIEAYKRLDNQCQGGAAASMAMVYFHRHGCLAAHIGNSRVYHIRPRTRKLMYKSRDDFKSMVPQTDNPAEPTKAYITDVRHGDYFLLLSKGAVDALFEKQIMNVVCGNESDEVKVRKLAEGMENSRDNYSAYLIHVSGVMAEEMDGGLKDNERQLMTAFRNMDDNDREDRHEEEAKTNRQTEPQLDDTEEVPKKKREFPIVWVTALSLVLLAGILLYVGQRPKKTEVEPVKEEVKKEEPKKDTIDVMKGRKDKPAKEDLFKDEKEKKEEPAKPKEEEKKEEPAATPEAEPQVTPEPSEPEVTPVVTPPTEPVAPPAETETPPATVTPKPVIPDE